MARCMFLILPGEIRNQIYHLLLVIQTPGTPRSLGVGPKIYPQILNVCRQVYHEASDILYGKNTFIAHYSLLSQMPQLRRWHDPITSAALIARIKRYHIYVRLDCDAWFTAARARDAFMGTEELTVEVFQAQYGSSDYTVLRLFEEVRSVKRVRFIGSVGGFPEYISWLQTAMMSPKGVGVLPYIASGTEIARDIWTHGGR